MATDSGGDPPGFLVPGIRCAVEMFAVGAIMLLVGLPATNRLYFGMVVGLTTVSITVVLFWCLNRQMKAWITHARRQGRGRASQSD